MQASCDVVKAQHGREDREFLALLIGLERFNLEKLQRYTDIEGHVAVYWH